MIELFENGKKAAEYPVEDALRMGLVRFAWIQVKQGRTMVFPWDKEANPALVPTGRPFDGRGYGVGS